MGRWLNDRIAVVLALVLVGSLWILLTSLISPRALMETIDEWRYVGDPTTWPTTPAPIEYTAFEWSERGGYVEFNRLRDVDGRPDFPKQTDRTFTVEHGLITRANLAHPPSGLPIWFVPILVAFPLMFIAMVRWKRRTGPIRFWRSAGRWTLVAIAFACEALTVASIVFAIRSYPYFERFDWRVIESPAAVQVNSSRGSLMLAWTESGPNHSLPGNALLFIRSTIPETRGPLYLAAELKGDFSQATGFTFGSDGTTWLWRNVLVVPYWFVIVALAAITFGLSRLDRSRRQTLQHEHVGHCRNCGYDLRHSAERCPECGTAFAPTIKPSFGA